VTAGPPTLIPQLADPAVAAASLDAHLARILRGRAPADVGWDRPDKLTLFVPMRGFTVETDFCSYGFDPSAADAVPYADQPDGDDYLLRLFFSHYPQSPPSARFVNPTTRKYDVGTDVKWLPSLEGGTEVHVHQTYETIGQLVCTSSTLEFYKVNHSVEPKHQWRPGSTFIVLLNTLSRYMRPPIYKGRQG
jgi:hypothetical protein